MASVTRFTRLGVRHLHKRALSVRAWTCAGSDVSSLLEYAVQAGGRREVLKDYVGSVGWNHHTALCGNPATASLQNLGTVTDAVRHHLKEEHGAVWPDGLYQS